MVALELDHITVKANDEPWLTDVSARFEPGVFNVLLGPTLAGKTTLLRVMAGLDAPTSGALSLHGKDLTGVPVKKRSIAFVYQQFINYPSLSVYDNIASPLKVAGGAKAQISARVEKIAELLSITPMLNRKPLELSGGQQQRVALARALVKEADLVLLDEPLANLDYKLREELRAELPKLFAETGSVVVYATTEPEEALMLGGHITLMHEGRIIQDGPTPNVYREPENLLAARTFSDPPLNSVGAHMKAGEIRLVGLTEGTKAPAGLADGAYQIGFRAHHLRINKPAGPALAVKAKIAVTEITGSESFIHVDALSERWTALTHGVHPYAAGEQVILYIDPGDCLFFGPDGKRVEAR